MGRFTWILIAVAMVIGAPAQAYISSEINPSGQFSIAGGNPGQKICWNVYAQRNDEYVQQNPLKSQVEIQKRPDDDGLYMMPELYGQPEEMGIMYKHKVNPSSIQAVEDAVSQRNPSGTDNRAAKNIIPGEIHSIK